MAIWLPIPTRRSLLSQAQILSRLVLNSLLKEDLAINWTRDDLREAFFDTMKELNAQINDQLFPPTFEDFHLFSIFQNIAQEMHMFSPTLEYSGRVLDSLSKIGKRVLVYSRNKNVAGKLIDKIKRGDYFGRSISNSFREYLLSEEDLQKSMDATISQLKHHYLAMGHEAIFRDEILPLLSANSKSITKEISRKKLDSILETCTYEDILEKYAYLSYLVSKDHDVFLGNGVPYFEHTVFSRLFEGKSQEKITRKYMEIEKELRKEFCKEVNTQIERVPHYSLLPGERKSR